MVESFYHRRGYGLKHDHDIDEGRVNQLRNMAPMVNLIQRANFARYRKFYLICTRASGEKDLETLIEKEFRTISNQFYSRLAETMASDELSESLDLRREATIFELIYYMKEFSSPKNRFGFFHSDQNSKPALYSPVMMVNYP